jgi:uncharacterized membrane protein
MGDEQWHPLGDFPEFNASGTALPPPVAAAAPAPGQGPVIVDPKAYADDLIARAAPLGISDCLERSWELLKAHFWPIVGSTFVALAVMVIANAIPFIGMVVSVLFTGIFYGGLYAYYLKKIRGQPTELADVFSGFALAFVPLMLATVVTTLMTTLGLVLLILPGIYLGVAYVFTFMLVIDKRLEFWAAMEVSRRVITAQWWRMFGLLILASIIAVLGVVGLVIGLFITIPIYIGAIVYAYEDLCNPPPKP